MLTFLSYGLLFRLLSIPFISTTNVHFRLYHSDRVSDNDLYYDCLLYDGAYRFPQYTAFEIDINRPYQIIPFCIRSISPYDNISTHNKSRTIHGTPITFETLRKQNITSEQLYLSSAPIDVVERYQAFLESSDNLLSKQEFYNCSIPWFGEFCQYKFDLINSFDEILRNYFANRRSQIIYPFNNGTCYIFIKCDRGPSPSCIDWREICDGKIDCLDGGGDELGCDQLDNNECTAHEYRCGNGLCIPNDFFNDDQHNPECIDRSDEKKTTTVSSYHTNCPRDPTFRCEETTCRNEGETPCGDGNCSPPGVCHSKREELLLQAKLARNANLHLSSDCWTSLICLTVPKNYRLSILNITGECPSRYESKIRMQKTCQTSFFFPFHPIVLGHVRFAYAENFTTADRYNFLSPQYVCYDQQFCESFSTTVQMNGSSCLLLSELDLPPVYSYWSALKSSATKLFLRCSLTNKTYKECPKSKPFRCANSSKCLAINRLVDGFSHCFQGDDEQINNSCLLPDKRYRFKCLLEQKCLAIEAINNGPRNCIGSDELDTLDGTISSRRIRVLVSYSTLCDGFVDHDAIDGLNYTDEMDCEHWPCNNVYTRCDDHGVWNCPNGADEVDCPRNPCRPDAHPCILPHSYNFTCLPLSRVNDGIIDCLGAYDERTNCQASNRAQPPQVYHCFNKSQCISLPHICGSTRNPCVSDEEGSHLCENVPSTQSWCANFISFQPSQILDGHSYMCSLELNLEKPSQVPFTLKNHLIYPIKDTTTTNDLITITAVEVVSPKQSNFVLNDQPINHELNAFCNRGILVYSNDSRGKYCLCPPAYFGYRCEYQSQRVSLTLQFRAVEWRTIFNIIIMLIDNNTNIHSYEQLDYLSVRDCRKKFNVYLLYSIQPRLLNHTYHVRIDVYDKAKKEYYLSTFYPIRFSFLPVHRLSFQVDIPPREFLITFKRCPLKCIHGQCTRFTNFEKFFCRCIDGYSGTSCSIKNNNGCKCSPGSICVGITNNRSICVCPLDKFGPRCYLKTRVCMSSSCHNGSQCVATDIRISKSEYFCICPESFIGSNCSKRNMKIEIHFAKNIFIPQSILIHFIKIPPKYTTYPHIIVDPSQTTMISKIKFDQIFAVVHHTDEFHLIFIEFNKDYYLALLQHNYTLVKSISTTIIPEHRCVPLSKLLDDNIRSFSTWRRAKYYHIPCQEQFNLMCFYDDDEFMCLCNVDRHANCFKFDYHRKYNCSGYNYCENDGQCYQDNNTCPTSSLCSCSKCYYGNRCQFTSSGYGLSLDDILGYSIWPNVPFSRQPTVVKVSASITIVMFVLAIINSVLSIITFQTKQSLKIGCGLYLLASSIISSLTMVMFALKFLLLVLSQMSIITNHSFLRFKCIIMDMSLKSCLAIGDWLNACVAVERVLTIHIGVKFNKNKSKKISKSVIFGICLFTFISYIHDPIYRHLLEDNEEQRKWCIVRYPSSITAVALFTNIFHFFLPFAINILSVITIIILMARQKSNVGKQQGYKKYLWKQFQHHKHRLFSSLILVIIAIPRLVISFISECMKSIRNPWLHLSGYFVSFVPPLLVFILFVLPSEFYRKEFSEATTHIKKIIQRRFARK